MGVCLKRTYIFLLLFLLLGNPCQLFSEIDNSTTSSSDILLNIPQNSTLHSISNLLEEKEIIPNAFSFKVLAYITGNSRSLKSGTYSFNGKENIFDVLNKLKLGIELLVKVTIPEGYNKWEIYSLLQKSELSNPGKYIDAEKSTEVVDAVQKIFPKVTDTEGLLFPDTYSFSKATLEKDVLIAMIKNFKDRLPNSYFEITVENDLTPYEVLTLASIIEKETGNPDERGNISSVFHNRLRIGYPLATDPTVIYGIKNFDGNIRKKHLKQKTPYNTYLMKGLTPTPISNPGLEAIHAAMNPLQSKYLYFVAKGNGSSYFSKNLQEHNQAVRKYQLNRRKDYRSY